MINFRIYSTSPDRRPKDIIILGFKCEVHISFIAIRGEGRMSPGWRYNTVCNTVYNIKPSLAIALLCVARVYTVLRYTTPVFVVWVPFESLHPTPTV